MYENENFSFETAFRAKIKARVAFTGPTGSGKTYSALVFADGLAPGGTKARPKVAVIDTEANSARLYAGRPGIPPFRVLEFRPPFDPRRYVAAIRAAERLAAEGIEIIVVDSLTHAWAGTGGALELKDILSTQKGMNGYTAWNKIGEYQNQLMNAILDSTCHVLAAMRSKMAYDAEGVNDKGKKTITKLGLAPIQRDGVEYEFTTVLDVSTPDHIASSSKDRSGIFGGKWMLIDASHGRDYAVWLDGDAAAIAQEATRTEAARRQAEDARVLREAEAIAPIPSPAPPAPATLAPPPARVVLPSDQIDQRIVDAIAAAARAAGWPPERVLAVADTIAAARLATLWDLSQAEAAKLCNEIESSRAPAKSATVSPPPPSLEPPPADVPAVQAACDQKADASPPQAQAPASKNELDAVMAAARGAGLKTIPALRRELAELTARPDANEANLNQSEAMSTIRAFRVRAARPAQPAEAMEDVAR